jgi:hypothetical protein
MHYNKYVRHIPYAVVAGMGYQIDDKGVLLEDLEAAFEGVDALGNPIEKGGRPWKKDAVPETREKGTVCFRLLKIQADKILAAKRAQARAQKLALEAALAGADGASTF